MAIKKHVQYNPHTQTMSGFVDRGDGFNETDTTTEALVFMVVGLQGHWKPQIAYYLTKSLSPETQKVLVVQALEELHAQLLGKSSVLHVYLVIIQSPYNLFLGHNDCQIHPIVH